MENLVVVTPVDVRLKGAKVLNLIGYAPLMTNCVLLEALLL